MEQIGGSTDQKLKLNLLQTLSGHNDRVWHIDWSSSGKYLASCGGDKTVRIWKQNTNSKKWETVATLEETHQRTIRRIAWSPDEKFLACASFDSTVSIWERKNGEDFECISTLEGHENEVKSVSWDHSGSLLATCSRDKSVWIWEMEKDAEFECIAVLHGHSQDVKCVLWHPSQELLFSASYDDSIKVWKDEDDDWYCQNTLNSHKSTIWDLAFDKNGHYLASCSDDCSIKIWNTQTSNSNSNSNNLMENVFTVENAHERGILSVNWFQEYLASGASDNSLKLWKWDNTLLTPVIHVPEAHSSDINCVRWAPHHEGLHGGVLGTAGDDHLIHLWEFSSQQ